MSFLPNNYEAPQGGGSYTKLKAGENRIRIVSNSLLGWLGWDADNKPHRSAKKEGLDSLSLRDKPRHFWAFLIWNYATDQIEILEVTQRSIQDGIMSLYHSEDWGDPKGYDILVMKTGEGMETKYTIQGTPKSKLDIDQVFAAFKKSPIDLSRLITGDDPFDAANDEADMLIQKFEDDFNADGLPI